MHPRQKRDLVANLAPAAVPIIRAAINYRFEQKMLEHQKDYEVELAETRAEGLKAINSPNTTPENGSHPREPQVYHDIRALRDATQCGFCHSAAEALLDQEPDVAREGLEELQKYEARKDQLIQEGADDQRMEEEIGSLVEEWEVVPQVVGGMA